MHHWSTTRESAIAPGPIVPTYRPSLRSSKANRKKSSMRSSISDPESTIPLGAVDLSRPQASPPRPQARSAGMAERPSRNESLSDLVRFFQTSEDEPPTRAVPVRIPTSPESTTALPIVTETMESVEAPIEPTKETKPLRRRFLQFTQRHKKDPFTKSKLNESQRQIEALQREGFLLAAPKPKSTRSSKTSTSSRNSLERTFSKSKKQDVETIGQPWLETDSKRGSSEFKQHLASLNLSDFGSMVDVAVSLSKHEEDVSPPPYQPPSSSTIPTRNGHYGSSYSASSVPPPGSSAYARPENSNPLSSPMSTTATHGSASPHGHDRQASTSTSNSSNRLILDPDIKSPSRKPKLGLDERQTGASSISSVSGSIKIEPSNANTSKPVQASDKTALGSSGSSGLPPSLKLFPAVAPPRLSSKNSWNALPVAPSKKSPRLPSSVNSLSNQSVSDGKSVNARLRDISSEVHEENGGRSVSGATVRSTVGSTSNETQLPSSISKEHNMNKSLLSSQATMGTLQSFPMPAPTRPLPSLPQPGRAPPAIPESQCLPTAQIARTGLKALESTPLHSCSMTEETHAIDTEKELPVSVPDSPSSAVLNSRSEPETGSGADPESPSSAYIQDISVSTFPQQNAARQRAPSIRIPRVQEPRDSAGYNEPEGAALADSPLLGRTTEADTGRKRSTRKKLEIDSASARMDRSNLPFGLPSPPPTAVLPSDPPSQSLPDRPSSSKNKTASELASGRILQGVDLHHIASHRRRSMISRSNSSHSSLRHESIPESAEPSHSESPLPSSDDEGFGPNAEATRARRAAEKSSRLLTSLHHGYATVDARPSHSRPRYPQSIRSQTPQGRTSSTLERTATSPQSNYSHSTRRSRESRSSHWTQPGSSQMAHYLEDRVANLERQNQVLQAALLAALNAGVKNPFEGLSDFGHSSSLAQPRHATQYQTRFASRPDSWVGSTHSSDPGGFEAPAHYHENRPHMRQLDNMMEDIESGWLSDKSSVNGARMARER
ncbi:hypothetical protein POX_f07483 [Penicillium oxalicum]|uniref:hypothetical protein n=1 Tax=Penicillium oxalicum TaxID=69781 RepID=UPI0020B7B72B|nr:hypothetical protein POX_f07483 [Penicillium oxalicum]KAI2787123.1 hypothetical protein POX_f07483 [Penicillium oxalicum]